MNANSVLPSRPVLPKPRFPTLVARSLNKVFFIAFHVLAFGCFFYPPTATSIALCVGLYVLRMFGITGGYHRYFAHRAYKTSRWFQFVLGWIGASAMQKGPLWWAANHRDHHRYSDMEEDPHSPVRHGIFWAHVGWVLCRTHDERLLDNIEDFRRYPELRVLEALHWVPGIFAGLACYLIDGWSGLFWGFILSTVLLYHGTFLVNSICHIFGRRRFNTTDASRNNAIVAILTLGEGWHNNHHHYMSSANQGFRWYEIDISYYTLKLLSLPGLVWDLRKPPANKLAPETEPSTP